MSLQAEKLALGLILNNLHELGWEHYELDYGDDLEFVGEGTIDETVEHCAAVEMCTLWMRKEGGRNSFMRIIWGNSPSELIADHSCSRGFDDDVDAALKAVWPEWPLVDEADETEGYLRRQVAEQVAQP